MKIGIMSDSHDKRENIRKALKIFEKNEVETVIHAGDLISPFCIELFNNYTGKFYLCEGNNKGDIVLINEKIEGRGYFFEDIGKFILDNKKFALYHGTKTEVLNSLIYGKERFDYVIYGHSHKKVLKKIENTLVINPGEVYDLYGDPSVAILDTKTNSVKFFHLYR
ncbi:MAG: metallophosphoesterase [Candidatus Heimdallarchaeum aukensis]|uniref:Phosphoesterase n=1 Tax=Candidatus Heimdallarchaeum aukensis TaxID=2876573 RepID=A0A9Y1FKI7_9ARCH|nr:MAG: metallophosphoesterase [Candidatus Heimdallarchaeum aukensis]